MRILIATAMLAAALPSVSHAQSTEEERRAACTGDALTYCAIEIPDRQRIRACLVAKRAEISPECRTVIDGGRPQAGSRRG